MPRFSNAVSKLAASLSVISVTTLKVRRFVRDANKAFGEIQFVRENMATLQDVDAAFTRLDETIVSEAQQQSQEIAALREQIAQGANSEVLQTIVDRMDARNERIKTIVPDQVAASGGDMTGTTEGETGENGPVGTSGVNAGALDN